ncbi:MAG: preprotein translocase subunit SecE [Pirellulales bacterium]|nr:preprotein translocase subunit SecE [Pirellulales bacterium]
MNAFFQELFRTGLYKRSQGRIVRQVTFAAVALAVALGLYRLSVTLDNHGHLLQYGLPGLLLVAGVWTAYRLVNLPAFADFLIAVEAEMNKVSWPTRHELFRGSSVVLVTIIALAAVLFLFDNIWVLLFTRLGIIG